MATAVTLDPSFVAAFRAGTLTAAQVEAIVPDDRAAIIFLLLQLSHAVAGREQQPASTAHQPSSATPPYAKPAAKPRRKRRGAQPGHPGTSRTRPEHIDRHQTHQLPCCPDCGGTLQRTGRTRTRIVEDIPENLQAEVTEHTIHRDWCPCCKKQVEPKVPDALPQCTLGNRAVTLSAWLHYGLGTTTSQIVEVFNQHLHLPITGGGLMQMWHRLADVFWPWCQQIQRDCLDAAVLNADETGWRVEGKTWWLWCFAADDCTYYLLDRSRGHPALQRFFVEEFRGILVTDFWAAYEIVGRTKQKCWPHLLRDVQEVDDGQQNGGDWAEFAKKLRRIYGDAIRLAAARATMPDDEYQSKLARLHVRMVDVAVAAWTNPHAQRLADRLHKYGEQLLTFVEFEGVPADNNRAEREVRPAVMMRKNSYGNQSERGALTRAVLMTVLRTLKKRGLDVLDTITAALRTLATTGQLPPLPQKSSSEG